MSSFFLKNQTYGIDKHFRKGINFAFFFIDKIN